MSQSHFPQTLGQQQSLNHHMESSSILTIPHSPPSPAIDSTTTNFTHPGSQRKFTLLARPQQQLPSNTYQHSLTSTDPLNSSDVACLNQQSMIQPSGTVAGRAARDDYYDTEDPSVNLHEFLVNSMQAQKNRIILMKLEEEFVSYVADPARTEPLKLPPWDSYHRMLAHRVAAYFGLEHNVDPVDKTRVIVGKGPNTRVPQIRFGDYLSMTEDSESPEPKLILKRSSKEVASVDNKLEAALASIEAPSSSSDVKGLKSFEEREEEYEKARAQIFNQHSPLQSTLNALSFDVPSKSTQIISSSIFPPVMQHRRAASDTAMFRRVVTADSVKEGSSSNHSSRSATPLVTSLLRPAGSCELHSSSIHSQVQGLSIQPRSSPPKTAQLHSSVLDSQSQSTQYLSQTPSSSDSNSPSKYNSSRTVSQHTGCGSQVNVTATNTVSPATSIHYQPVQAHTGVPVMYPHTPAALLADPSWYPYHQMMLYQVPPQGYVPTAAHFVGSSPHVIQGAVYQPFVNPGVIGQHAIVPPPVTTNPQQVGHPGAPVSVTRIPLAVDPLSSPSHPNSGVALVRPVPQQPSPVRLGKVEGTWNFSPNHQFNMQQSMMAQQVAVGNAGQPTFATVLPISQQLTPQHLAEQLENSLHISTPSSNPSHDADPDPTPRVGEAPSKSNINPKAKLMSGITPMDGSEGDSGFMSHVIPRVPGSGPFSTPMSAIGEHAMFGGQMISPTHPQGPLQYMQPQMQAPLYGSGSQEGTGYMNNQTVLPNSSLHFQAGTPSQPSTPTIGPLNLAPGILQAQQGVFSPPSTGITRSPVQILGHTLGTSLFSPPPSSGNQHGLFVNSPTSSAKIGFSSGTPNHPPVGSGTRFRHFDSPKQSGGHISEVSASVSTQSGFQSLPPRLAQQQNQKSGYRYQNQRHPSNRVSVKGNNHNGSTGPVTLGDHMPSQFVAVSGSSANKREPLLPTPPFTHLVKLDTSLTCGVPLNIMEVVDYPPEGTAERVQASKAISKLKGLVEVKNGKISKTGEEVTVAVFSSQDTAMQALQMKYTQFSLSIPRSNHAKFILTMLQML